MIIETDYYGTIEYDSKDLIHFADGLFGFPDLHDFLPLRLSEDDESILVLIAIDEKRIAFVVINPLFLCPHYELTLQPEELAYLNVSDVDELSCFVICVVKEDYRNSTVNLKCPLLIHPETREGIQVIMESSPYGYSHPISSFPVLAGTGSDSVTEVK